MQRVLGRRRFLEAGAAAGAMLSAGRSARAAADTVTVAVMGVNSRGSGLIGDIVQVPGVEIACLVDVDERAAARESARLEGVGRRAPRVERDVRRVVADRSIDALVIATPNHWHAPATILAAAHGRHVYCEKPCSHNPREGELMIEAARKHRIVFQHGTQRRSSAATRAAIEALREGVVGRVLHARAWYTNRRPSIGRGMQTPVPSWLDWDLWQGPAPEHSFLDNIVHYNWHWRWHWGGGELANNGPHFLDICRWGLGVDFPKRVTAMGGRLRYDDDQETPDTLNVVYDFGGPTILWEGESWSSRGRGGQPTGAEFLGETGTLALDAQGRFSVFDEKNKPVPEQPAIEETQKAPHMANFIDAIRGSATPNAGVEDAHRSTLLCHLGNIAHRTGRVLECDPASGRVTNVPEATRYWGREYRSGWEPVV